MIFLFQSARIENSPPSPTRLTSESGYCPVHSDPIPLSRDFHRTSCTLATTRSLETSLSTCRGSTTISRNIWYLANNNNCVRKSKSSEFGKKGMRSSKPGGSWRRVRFSNLEIPAAEEEMKTFSKCKTTFRINGIRANGYCRDTSVWRVYG